MATRIRTRSAPTVTRGMYVTRDCGTYFSSCDSGIHRSHSYVPLYESMEDVVTKNFERKRDEGKIINSPMEKISTLWHHTYGTYHADYSGFTDVPNSHKYFTLDIEATYFLPWTVVPTVPNDAVNEEALIDLAVSAAHANRSQAEFQALVSLAEANKTVQSIGSILGRIFKILKAVKALEPLRAKSEFHKIERILKSNADYRKRQVSKEFSHDGLLNQYLEARYALRPLIYDLNNAVKAWNKKIDQHRQTSRGYATDTWSSGIITDLHSDHYSREHMYETKTVHKVEVRAGVLDALKLDELDESLSIWGVDSIAESALELTSYSFIVGWFFNIADWVSAWAPKGGLEKLASWYTIKRTTTQYLKHRQSYPLFEGGYWNGKEDVDVYASGEPTATRVYTHVNRVPNPDIPALPRLDINVDTLKIIDLLAIARKSLLK